MRVLHTSDWHLGDRLGNIDRTEHQFRALEQVFRYIDEYNVDVLLVTGDVFNVYAGEPLARVLRRLAGLLRPGLDRGMSAIFLAGNHDREHFFSTARSLVHLVAPSSGARLHFCDRPQIVRAPSAGDWDLQIVVAPYPTADRYLTESSYTSVAAKNALLGQAYAEHLARARRELDERYPAILAAHVHVRGAEPHALYRISEADDVVLGPQSLPNWVYNALGHIHKPQSLPGMARSRYAGSIERMDMAEKDDDKSIVLLEIEREGLTQDPVLLPLRTTAFYDITVDASESLDALRERFPDREALVKLTVQYEPGRHNLPAVLNRLDAIFPNCYHRQPVPIGQAAPVSQLTSDHRDIAGTVREYLMERLASDPDREAIVERAAALVEELAHDTATS